MWKDYCCFIASKNKIRDGVNLGRKKDTVRQEVELVDQKGTSTETRQKQK